MAAFTNITNTRTWTAPWDRMWLPKFVWAHDDREPVFRVGFSNATDGPTIQDKFLTQPYYVDGCIIDVDKCSWPQKALIGIKLTGKENRIDDIIPGRFIGMFYGLGEIHLYPLIQKSVVNQEQFLSYLARFDVHVDVITSLSVYEKICYIADQLNMDLASGREVSVAEYFDGCFYRE